MDDKTRKMVEHLDKLINALTDETKKIDADSSEKIRVGKQVAKKLMDSDISKLVYSTVKEHCPSCKEQYSVTMAMIVELVVEGHLILKKNDKKQ